MDVEIGVVVCSIWLFQCGSNTNSHIGGMVQWQQTLLKLNRLPTSEKSIECGSHVRFEKQENVKCAYLANIVLLLLCFLICGWLNVDDGRM